MINKANSYRKIVCQKSLGYVKVISMFRYLLLYGDLVFGNVC